MFQIGEFSDVEHSLAQLRRQRRLTQGALARRLSLPRSAISKIEQGQRRVSLSEFMGLAGVFGLTDAQAMALARELVSEPPPATADEDLADDPSEEPTAEVPRSGRGTA